MRQRLAQAGHTASAWKSHIYRATEARCPRDSARLQTARKLGFSKRPIWKTQSRVSQSADGQIKKLPTTWRPPHLGITPTPEVNLIKSGKSSNCDRGWKWETERVRRDLA